MEGFLGERIDEILSGQTSPVVVNVLGPDLGELRVLAGQVAHLMETTPGIGFVHPEPQIDVPQLVIRPDRDGLAKYGVSEQQLVDDVIRLRQGRPVTQVLGTTGRIVDVVVAGMPSQRDALGDLPIDTAGPSPVVSS